MRPSLDALPDGRREQRMRWQSPRVAREHGPGPARETRRVWLFLGGRAARRLAVERGRPGRPVRRRTEGADRLERTDDIDQGRDGRTADRALPVAEGAMRRGWRGSGRLDLQARMTGCWRDLAAGGVVPRAKMADRHHAEAKGGGKGHEGDPSVETPKRGHCWCHSSGGERGGQIAGIPAVPGRSSPVAMFTPLVRTLLTGGARFGRRAGNAPNQDR
jgi:hypothetical protein